LIEHFGNLENGETVERVVISNADLTVSLITYGASIQDIRLAGHSPSLVLGFPKLEPYLRNQYFGAMVGRVANRIANGRFELGGNNFQTDRNEHGKTTLHGGAKGISNRVWKLVDHDKTSATFSYVDLGMKTGFPGDCEITCRYLVTTDNALEYEITAVSTQDTICNIAHHSYFNLSGSDPIFHHELEVDADHFLPVDEAQIPTGQKKSVIETDFDFRTRRQLAAISSSHLDHNFCLSDAKRALQKVGELHAHSTGIKMEFATTEPGLQIYTGSGLAITDPGHDGAIYSAHTGIAIEPQGWPNACNEPGFPSTKLTFGETYRQKSQFKFSINKLKTI